MTSGWPSTLRLAGRVLSLGECLTQDADAAALREAERALLSPAMTPKRRRELCAGRIAAHRAIAHWTDAPLAVLARPAGADAGRPVTQPDVGLALSITHGAGRAVAAASPGAPLGVDVESLGHALEESFAREAFAPGELERFSGPSDVSPAVLLWALKEAMLKTWGVGLRAPLQQVALSTEGEVAWGRPFSLQVTAAELPSGLERPPGRLEAIAYRSEGCVLALVSEGGTVPNGDCPRG